MTARASHNAHLCYQDAGGEQPAPSDRVKEKETWDEGHDQRRGKKEDNGGERPLYAGPFQTHGTDELDRECKRIPRRAVRETRQRVHCQALRTVEAYSMHMCEPDTVQTRSRQVPTMSVSLKMPLRRSNFESLRTGDLGCFQEALLQSESAVASASLPSCFKPMVSKSQGAL